MHIMNASRLMSAQGVTKTNGSAAVIAESWYCCRTRDVSWTYPRGLETQGFACMLRKLRRNNRRRTNAAISTALEITKDLMLMLDLLLRTAAGSVGTVCDYFVISTARLEGKVQSQWECAYACLLGRFRLSWCGEDGLPHLFRRWLQILAHDEVPVMKPRLYGLPSKDPAFQWTLPTWFLLEERKRN